MVGVFKAAVATEIPTSWMCYCKTLFMLIISTFTATIAKRLADMDNSMDNSMPTQLIG